MKKTVLFLMVTILLFSVFPVANASSVERERPPVTENLMSHREIVDELRSRIENLENISDPKTQEALFEGLPIEDMWNQNEMLDELHNEAVKHGLVSLNEDGLIELHETQASAKVLGVDKHTYDNYLFRMEIYNNVVSTGGYNYDSDLNLARLSSEEAIKNDIAVKSQKNSQLNSLYSESTGLNTLNSTLPVLNAIGIVSANRQELNDKLIYYIYTEGSVDGLLTAAIWWVNKVWYFNDWDYKNKSGYVNVTWNAFTRYSYTNGTARTSEWLGNYNYGYTGKVLFPLSVLYAGSYGASLMWSNGVDTVNDREAIKMGFDENINN